MAKRGLTTGEVAAKYGQTEPYIQGLLRHAKMPKPPMQGRRRVWYPEHVEALGKLLKSRGVLVETTRGA